MVTEVKKTILVVDDDVDLLSQIEIQLKSAGFDVVTADGQDEAEIILKTMKPDLVISDLMMENLDGGFSLSYHVKKMDPSIPVIIITGVTHELGFKFFTDTEEERSWVKADAILNKPVRFEQLMMEINKYLG
jgi:CheY-like chemotaxis protein